MINVKNIIVWILLGISVSARAQQDLSGINTRISSEVIKKAGSGRLIKVFEERMNPPAVQSLNSESSSLIPLIIYSESEPSGSEINQLKQYGAVLSPSSWIPPVKGHSKGFLIAEVPAENLEAVLSLSFVQKADVADALSVPLNNLASKKINADKVWLRGIKGKGVKVAVLDTGLDLNPVNPDLPETVEFKDYSNFPEIDDDVENHVNGHGTHVTATLLGRGVLSEDNTINGGGEYKGMAPAADLVFLKIGNDIDGSARLTAMIEALRAAVEIYKADLINLSYGSWDIYHDGSSAKDQIVDWCYSMGVPVFVAAGNEGASMRHYSGTVKGEDSTDFIKINVKNAAEVKTMLAFNLVWSDGDERNNLKLKYYDAAKNEIRSCGWPATESERGTESQLSQATTLVPSNAREFYLRVINPSPSTQRFHIYENYTTRSVTFENADPAYTITSPGTADHAFTVGAYNSRREWTIFDGTLNPGRQELTDAVSSFSSRGPRIDGAGKPDITAPGSSVISLRDRDVFNPDFLCVDNDGINGGRADYVVMQGTSMASPVCAGAAALYLEVYPNSSAEEVYNALRSSAANDSLSGYSINGDYGYGKLDIFKTLEVGLSPLTFTEDETANKLKYLLGQNYPNPFNSSTTINYSIPFESHVRLVIYNLLGEEVAVAVDAVVKPGSYKYNFNSSSLPSGVYFYSMEAKGISEDGKASSFHEVKKMISVK